MAKKKKERLCFSLRRQTIDLLEKLAEEQELSKSQAIEWLVWQLLEERKKNNNESGDI